MNALQNGTRKRARNNTANNKHNKNNKNNKHNQTKRQRTNIQQQIVNANNSAERLGHLLKYYVNSTRKNRLPEFRNFLRSNPNIVRSAQHSAVLLRPRNNNTKGFRQNNVERVAQLSLGPNRNIHNVYQSMNYYMEHHL